MFPHRQPIAAAVRCGGSLCSISDRLRRSTSDVLEDRFAVRFEAFFHFSEEISLFVGTSYLSYFGQDLWMNLWVGFWWLRTSLKGSVPGWVFFSFFKRSQLQSQMRQDSRVHPVLLDSNMEGTPVTNMSLKPLFDHWICYSCIRFDNFEKSFGHLVVHEWYISFLLSVDWDGCKISVVYLLFISALIVNLMVHRIQLFNQGGIGD